MPKKTMKKWTVVGFYEDNAQPSVHWIDAPSAEDAAYEVKGANSGVRIVEVFAGHQQGRLKNDEVL